MSFKFSIKVFYIAFATCLLILASTVNAQSRGGDRPKLVVLESLNFEYETSVVEAVGTAQAKQSITLFASVSDEVTQVNFTPGQAVMQGDVLVALDSRLQDVAIDRNQIEVEDAKRNLQRVKASVERGAVTQRELDVATTLLKLAQVNLKEALENKEDRLVRAPFDGIVGLTDIEVGDRISPQTEITTLDNRQQLFINFVAPELAVSYLLEKPDVNLQPWTNRELIFQAPIAEIDSRINAQDRTLRARALLDNSLDQYRPGMSFRVTLELRGERFVAIPEAALSWGTSGAFVWLAEDSKAKRVDVQVKQRLRGRILVDGQLSDGERLIVEGIQGLRPGQALRIQEKRAESKQESDTQISGKVSTEATQTGLKG